MSDKIWRQIQ